MGVLQGPRGRRFLMIEVPLKGGPSAGQQTGPTRQRPQGFTTPGLEFESFLVWQTRNQISGKVNLSSENGQIVGANTPVQSSEPWRAGLCLVVGLSRGVKEWSYQPFTRYSGYRTVGLGITSNILVRSEIFDVVPKNAKPHVTSEVNFTSPLKSGP